MDTKLFDGFFTVYFDDTKGNPQDLPPYTKSIYDNLIQWQTTVLNTKKWVAITLSTNQRKYTNCAWLNDAELNTVVSIKKALKFAIINSYNNLFSWIIDNLEINTKMKRNIVNNALLVDNIFALEKSNVQSLRKEKIDFCIKNDAFNIISKFHAINNNDNDDINQCIKYDCVNILRECKITLDKTHLKSAIYANSLKCAKCILEQINENKSNGNHTNENKTDENYIPEETIAKISQMQENHIKYFHINSIISEEQKQKYINFIIDITSTFKNTQTSAFCAELLIDLSNALQCVTLLILILESVNFDITEKLTKFMIISFAKICYTDIRENTSRDRDDNIPYQIYKNRQQQLIYLLNCIIKKFNLSNESIVEIAISQYKHSINIFAHIFLSSNAEIKKEILHHAISSDDCHWILTQISNIPQDFTRKQNLNFIRLPSEKFAELYKLDLILPETLQTWLNNRIHSNCLYDTNLNFLINPVLLQSPALLKNIPPDDKNILSLIFMYENKIMPYTHKNIVLMIENLIHQIITLQGYDRIIYCIEKLILKLPSPTRLELAKYSRVIYSLPNNLQHKLNNLRYKLENVNL
jgi:hypothetical protein